MPFVSLLAFCVLQNCLLCIKLNIIGVLVLSFHLQEDVAIGIMAERCGIFPTGGENKRLVTLFRTSLPEEEIRVFHGLKIEVEKLTAPDMRGRIVQHRIHDTLDMKEHWAQLQDPEGYKPREISTRDCWRQCPPHVKNKNIILLDHYGMSGVNDRMWIFLQVVQLAGYLCATVRVPPPRTMVSRICFDTGFICIPLSM